MIVFQLFNDLIVFSFQKFNLLIEVNIDSIDQLIVRDLQFVILDSLLDLLKMGFYLFNKAQLLLENVFYFW